jgi:methyl-accepting chemotaxis protein
MRVAESEDRPSMELAREPIPHYRDAEYLLRVRDYKMRVSNLYPEIPHSLLQNCSISPIDTLVIGYFLEYLDREVTVYEIGSFVGASSYLFATHPKVSKLVCIDPNPSIADEAVANSEWTEERDLSSLQDLRVFDVARGAFASLDEQALNKVEFREGVVGSESLGTRTERKWQSGKVEIPQFEDSGDSLLAYVDGLHTKEGVREDLEAIYEQNPNAITLLDDCRNAWGAFVQSGVVDFIEQHESGDEYTFRLFADLGPGVATSSLGLLYRRDRAREVNAALRGVASKFSQRLDPVQLLIRENELILEVNRRINLASDEKEARNSLREKHDQLRRNMKALYEKLQRRDEKLRRHSQQADQLRERHDQLQEKHDQLRERRNQLLHDMKALRQERQLYKQQARQASQQADQLRERNDQLQHDNEVLLKTLQRRSHRVAEALVTSIHRIPGLRNVRRSG